MDKHRVLMGGGKPPLFFFRNDFKRENPTIATPQVAPGKCQAEIGDMAFTAEKRLTARCHRPGGRQRSY